MDLQRIGRGFWGGLLARVTGAPQFRFTISGDTQGFRALGQNASRFADLVSTKKVVEVSVTNRLETYGGTPQEGGGLALLPSQRVDPARVMVAPHPELGEHLGLGGLIGGRQGMVPPPNLFETMAHELLGHAWGELIAGHVGKGGFANKRDAVDAENAVRATDPSRGFRFGHHDTQVFTAEEIRALTRTP